MFVLLVLKRHLVLRGAVYRALALGILLLFTAPAAVALAEDDPLATLVDELATGLSSDPIDSTCAAPQALGIWPFDGTGLPVGAPIAEQIYGDLVAALVTSAPDCISVMDGDGIGAVLTFLNQTGALQEAGGNPIAALTAANRNVDIVVLPRLSVQAGQVLLSLKAVDRESGRTLAQTTARPLPTSRTEVALSDTARNLESAVAEAVRSLSDQAHDMMRLVPAGIYFQDTGAQPDFGRYLQDRVTAGLVTSLSNVITDRALSVIEPEFDLSKNVGQSLSARDLDPLARIAEQGDAAGLYQLTGTYWLLGDVIDITLTLKGVEGKAGSWQGRVSAGELGGMALRPANASIGAREDETGSFSVLMTSPRGENPVYYPGEEFVAYFRTDRRVWLYCFYIDAEGGVTEVLPNMFEKDFAAGHMLAPYILHTLPDPRRDPFTFRINASTLGEERLKCIATTRDVTDDLPPELRGQTFDPVPPRIAAEIDTIFDALPDVQLARTSVTVTIAPEQPR